MKLLETEAVMHTDRENNEPFLTLWGEVTTGRSFQCATSCCIDSLLALYGNDRHNGGPP